MRCEYCGSMIPDGTEHCPNCGYVPKELRPEGENKLDEIRGTYRKYEDHDEYGDEYGGYGNYDASRRREIDEDLDVPSVEELREGTPAEQKGHPVALMMTFLIVVITLVFICACLYKM